MRLSSNNNMRTKIGAGGFTPSSSRHGVIRGIDKGFLTLTTGEWRAPPMLSSELSVTARQIGTRRNNKSLSHETLVKAGGRRHDGKNGLELCSSSLRNNGGPPMNISSFPPDRIEDSPATPDKRKCSHRFLLLSRIRAARWGVWPRHSRNFQAPAVTAAPKELFCTCICPATVSLTFGQTATPRLRGSLVSKAKMKRCEEIMRGRLWDTIRRRRLGTRRGQQYSLDGSALAISPRLIAVRRYQISPSAGARRRLAKSVAESYLSRAKDIVNVNTHAIEREKTEFPQPITRVAIRVVSRRGKSVMS